jgi:hypothetical protein
VNLITRVDGVLREVARLTHGSRRDAAKLIRRLDNERRGHVPRGVGREREREVAGILGAAGWTVREFVERKLPLLELPDDLKGLVRRGLLAPTKALMLRRIADPVQRKARAHEVIAKGITVKELRGDPTPGRAPAPGSQADLNWIALEASRVLGTRVTITGDRVSIAYADGDGLNMILEKLGVEL